MFTLRGIVHNDPDAVIVAAPNAIWFSAAEAEAGVEKKLVVYARTEGDAISVACPEWLQVRRESHNRYGNDTTCAVYRITCKLPAVVPVSGMLSVDLPRGRGSESMRVVVQDRGRVKVVPGTRVPAWDVAAGTGTVFEIFPLKESDRVKSVTLMEAEQLPLKYAASRAGRAVRVAVDARGLRHSSMLNFSVRLASGAEENAVAWLEVLPLRRLDAAPAAPSDD